MSLKFVIPNYIDICDLYSRNIRKKRFIIDISDLFSRYISLTTVAEQDENTIRETILNKWILRFGVPREIHIDCGKVFESKIMKDFTRLMEIYSYVFQVHTITIRMEL